MRRGRIGSWVLLQPERSNAYAQAVIRTSQADEHPRGFLMEERADRMNRIDRISKDQRARPDSVFILSVLLILSHSSAGRGVCVSLAMAQRY
jgi:hypothetical protein